MTTPPIDSLQKRRQDVSATRHALAAALGVRETTIYRWETGRSRPNEAALRAWVHALEQLEEATNAHRPGEDAQPTTVDDSRVQANEPKNPLHVTGDAPSPDPDGEAPAPRPGCKWGTPSDRRCNCDECFRGGDYA